MVGDEIKPTYHRVVPRSLVKIEEQREESDEDLDTRNLGRGC